MIKDVVINDIEGMNILTMRSEKVAKGEDISELIRDLIDTAQAHKERCVGLAAIQIGVAKRVCVIIDGDDHWMPIINPIVVARSKTTHMSEEGCMSVEGTRTVKRYDSITIMSDVSGKPKKRVIGGMHAVILQHEMDHMNGIVI